ncbi:CD109 antigen-like isoform X2 [Neocloeon triangulifer]|uniref:CD109 antigen-like isoform X2 n=1 Tax=Neocloeon triangulifer TaxID=2078957 RepID=UPI00286F1B11|nr:CD109 antigen-like isoform X2 [Neocloeon triangulifer]
MRQQARAAIFVSVAVTVFSSALAQGFYTVIAPKVLRPNSEYHVSVSTHGVDRTTQVWVEVGGRQDSGGKFSASQSISVEPRTTRILRIDVGDVGPGNYNVTVRGSGGLDFQNSTELDYVHKSYTVLIQTDKAIYKPGDTIQFRCLALNKHLKPTVTAALDVFLTDGKGNRVKQWSRVLPTRGVFSAELPLSKNPVLGDWNITVSVLDQSFHKSIQVAEYVLPKFEVSISTPSYTTFKDSRISATITAKYTYGTPVKGEATVTMYPTIFSGIIQPIFQNPVRKVVAIDGKANVEFDIVKELGLKDDFERPVQIEVTVQEALTGRRQNSSTSIPLHKNKYKMELVKTSEYYKPGLKFTAFIKLSTHDGAPITDSKNPVKVRWGYGYDHDTYTSENHYLTSDGLVELTFYPPLVSNVSTLGLEAQYLDLSEWFSSITAAVSPSNTFLQASVRSENSEVGNDVEVYINCTEAITSFNYEVLGRGDVLTAGTVQVPAGQHDQRFRFVATQAMTPRAHLVVYYVRPENGEIIADAVDFSVSGMLQNFIDLEVNPMDTQPGGNVDVTIRTKPNSYVGLLGVDQSVLLLRKGNDLTMHDVENELLSYDSAPREPSNPLWSPFVRDVKRRRKRSLYWWPGSADAGEVFEKSGAVILTNGYVHEHLPLVYYRNLDQDIMFDEEDHENKEDLQGVGNDVVDGAKQKPPRVRKHFPETWLWELVDAGPDGRTSLKRKAPDTITSWVLSAFSVDSLYGLGLTHSPSKIRIFRPFFVSLDLPYNVKRGEVFAIPVVVFNYMERDVSVEVSLENSDGQFEVPDMSNDIDAPKTFDASQLTRKIVVKANSAANTAFMVTTKKLGLVDVTVKAESALAGDAVKRQLLVKAEGETQYVNDAVFVDLRDKDNFETNLTLRFPKNFVEGSERVEVSTVGDLLGPSIPNLANLIRIPFGCGEQNMLNFVPNIVVLDYLKNTNQLTTAVENKARKFLEMGYQQELTYRHDDGSFSAFGNVDPSGSTWLTAFVAKSFRAASPYITIDPGMVQQALQWLQGVQATNGSFPEVGKVHHHDMQGGSASGLALTAYTLITFLQDKESAGLYRNVINKATDYIGRNLDGRLDDPYAIALSAYALQLAGHPLKETAFNLLESKAQNKDETKWWSKPVPENDKKNPWRQYRTDPIAVEMTSYALMTYLERGLVKDSLPILKWLISQRNSQGGFESTQDTVVALAALAQLAEQISVSSSGQRVEVTFEYEGKNSPKSLVVNSNSAMILQKEELPQTVRDLKIRAQGKGFAIVQVSYSYNVEVTAPWPLFHLDPQLTRDSTPEHLQLSVCSGFTGLGNISSNMAVMEVSLPSGYTADPDSLPSLRSAPFVQRVETQDGDTKVVLYFDKMGREELCPTVKAFRTHRVARQRAVPVTIYDYYDSSRRARQFYMPRVQTMCDICEGDVGCEACGRGSAGSRRNGADFSAASAAEVSVATLTMVATALWLASF